MYCWRTNLNYDAIRGLIIQQTNNSNVFIGLYCCLLVKMQPLSLAWVGLHDIESLWALFQGPIVEFRLDYLIFYLSTSKFYPQQRSCPFHPYVNRRKNNKASSSMSIDSVHLLAPFLFFYSFNYSAWIWKFFHLLSNKWFIHHFAK